MCLNNVRSFLHNKNFSFKSHKVNWLVAIKCPGHFTSMDPILIPSTEANISSTEKGVLQWSCNTGEFSQGGAPLVDGKRETL